MQPPQRRRRAAACALQLIGLAGALWIAGCASYRTGAAHGRDLPNFQEVEPGLYRGAQPTRAGFERLQQMGIKTIVNLRGGDLNDRLLAGLALESAQRAMSPWSPGDDHVLWFLRLTTDPARRPLFVHCHHGSDRTGYLIAMHRIVVNGWDQESAIAEMVREGNGFHDIYQGLIGYIRRADVLRLRRALNPQAPAAGTQPVRYDERTSPEP